MQVKARRKDLDCAKGWGSCWSSRASRTGFAATPTGQHLVPVSARGIVSNSHAVLHVLVRYVTFLSGAAHTNAAKWPSWEKARCAPAAALPHSDWDHRWKWLASQFFHVDNMPGLFPSPVRTDLNTDNSPATFRVYVAVLFLFSVLTPRCHGCPVPVSVLVRSPRSLHLPGPHVLYLIEPPLTTFFSYWRSLHTA